MEQQDQVCIIIGASHAGVNCAFALRKEGWQGKILLIDRDPALPYHRPPLSKTQLYTDDPFDKHPLKPGEFYERDQIELLLGEAVQKILPKEKKVWLATGREVAYDKLVLATGARPIMPPIPGLDTAQNVFPIRKLADAKEIRAAIKKTHPLRVVIIGGGYIGLEAAASMRKLDAEVKILERESRILSRVSSTDMSNFYTELHREKGVDVLTGKNVVRIEENSEGNEIICEDGSSYVADIIIVGVGIAVNTKLAEEAGLALENGIKVNAFAQSSDPHVYAIGDCSFHHNPHYDRFIRLESVPHAVDQAKVAAANICGRELVYDKIPWFWSDQYEVKLQMVGLSQGYDQKILRKEENEANKFSIWYFQGDRLLALDAVNHAKAYVLGTKFIKSGAKLDKAKLADSTSDLKSADMILTS